MEFPRPHQIRDTIINKNQKSIQEFLDKCRSDLEASDDLSININMSKYSKIVLDQACDILKKSGWIINVISDPREGNYLNIKGTVYEEDNRFGH